MNEIKESIKTNFKKDYYNHLKRQELRKNNKKYNLYKNQLMFLHGAIYVSGVYSVLFAVIGVFSLVRNEMFLIGAFYFMGCVSVMTIFLSIVYDRLKNESY